MSAPDSQERAVPPKVSIITVAYNNCEGLRRTIQNVLALENADYELIVVDGGSSDGSRELLEEYDAQIEKWVSEPDQGIYDGMNKGIELASGEWIIFMNSGDLFTSVDTLSQFELNVGADIDVVYGYKCQDGKKYVPRPVSSIRSGLIFACHQAMLFRRGSIRYATQYKINSDLDFVCQYYEKNPDGFLYQEIDVVIPEGGGVSSVVSFQKRKDKFLIVNKHFGLSGVVKSAVSSLLERLF